MQYSEGLKKTQLCSLSNIQIHNKDTSAWLMQHSAGLNKDTTMWLMQHSAGLLFWFFWLVVWFFCGFRCGVPLLIVILVIYKYENR